MGQHQSQIPQQSKPIQIPKSQPKPLVSESLVTGSPLEIPEGSIGSVQLFPRETFQTTLHLQKEYIQPQGERDYHNSAKIVHGFGPNGLAPLASLNDKKQKTIPIMIVWSHPGKVVHLTGTFNNWEKKIRLQKSAEDFSTIVDMPPGSHQLKFIVDDEWKCSQDFPITSDQEGNLVNCIEVVDEDGKTVQDGLENISRDVEMVPESPIESYTCPPSPPPLDLNDQVPNLPSQLQKVLLNTKSVSHDPFLLPIPNHVSVNHLYACSIRDGVMAVAATTRYRNKYVTTVLYKPVQ